ncbi:MAG: hypothetical protein IPI57_18865 [Candidatus Competibacteraceae bacterium]|nr:hypothetical protein [Candidatus Competibacteraceae bacterium]
MTLKTHPKLHPHLLQSGDTVALEAASAAIKAIATPEWPFSKLQANGRMTLKTLAALQTYASLPEVREFLSDLLENNYRVNSRQWHYFMARCCGRVVLASPRSP